MSLLSQRRGVVLIAVIAIGIALVCLLAAGAQGGHGSELVAILPLLLVGLISPLGLLEPVTCVCLGRTADGPILPVRFQRPPPVSLA